MISFVYFDLGRYDSANPVDASKKLMEFFRNVQFT